MAEPDRVLKQAFAWYKASVSRALAASGLSPGDQAAATTLLWDALGLKNPGAPPANPDLLDFKEHDGAQESLAVAVTMVAEALVALGYVQQAVAAAGGGGLPAALAVVDPVLQQIERLRTLDATARYPSALTIGKILLMLSGDAQANPAAAHEADKLASLLGSASAGDVADTQAALGIVALLIGSLIDRSFTAPLSGAPALVKQALPSFAGKPKLTLKVPAALSASLGGDIEFNVIPPSAIKAGLKLALNKSKPIDGTNITLALTGTASVDVLVPVAPPAPAQVSNDYTFGLELTRKKTGGALVISNNTAGVTISIGELGVALQLKNGDPLLRFSAHDAKATIQPSDGFLKMILGDGISVALDVVAEADKSGTLRFVNGTGLRVSLPVPTLPTGPFELQLINLGLNPVGGRFTNLEIEVSASFGVALGPFAASVDRLGILAKLKGGAAGSDVQFAFKPPNGIGLSLDAGIVKGGGYLAVDEQGYAGILELKMMAVDVKAICLLNTHSEAGFSLLLLIFGQFPPIQLSFGFTLTGVGGLIGVQHTASPPALSQALGAGNLDAVLFPENPVANAPQIINTLRAMFPIKRGGFIIGPMLELGWGTPSLVTVRMGLLIEADGFVLLGQAIIQVPPLLSADLALLYLRLDFVGSVTFDPLRISFDAKLIHSRVALISITGQFAFRAQFGDQPTFLISAGGFHPRFKEVPSDIPMPFDRVGASLDIGIIGIELKGYFAITSATIQAGASLRAWADIGIASIEGGFGFDAICYLVPKFYFELDIFAYLDVHVFGIDFASIHLDGLLAGPGRWHIAGNAKVHTPWPLPDFSVHIDESWGSDRDTPQITVKVSEEIAKEIGKRANWSAQLPQGGTGMVTLADIDPGTDVLAHPLGTLLFQQKLVPFDLRMAKASGSTIEGANQFGEGALQLSQSGQAVAGTLQRQPRTDFFAAAQFLEMSQDDKLAKPSFEAFTAGYELGDDNFELGETVPVTLNYEEADLGVEELLPRNLRLRLTATGYSATTHGAMLAHGAAGRSPLRNRALTQPAQPAPIRVNPAPVTVATKDSMTKAAGASVQTSVWRAHQERAANTQVAVSSIAVVELAEIA
jgi:hypothetical protein